MAANGGGSVSGGSSMTPSMHQASLLSSTSSAAASINSAQAKPKRFTIAGYRAPASSSGAPALLGSGVPGPLTSAGSGIVASGMGGYGPGGATHVGSGDSRGGVAAMPGITAGAIGSVIANDARAPGSSSGQSTRQSSALPQLNLKGTTSNAGTNGSSNASGGSGGTGGNGMTPLQSGISSVNGNTTSGVTNGSNGNGVGDATPRTTARDATKRRTYAPAGATARAADAATAGKLPVAASGGRGGTTYINKRGTYEGGPLSPHAPPQSARASGDKALMSTNGSTAANGGNVNNGNDDINITDYANSVKATSGGSSSAATSGVATSRQPATDRGSLAPSSTERARETTAAAASSTSSGVIASSSSSSAAAAAAASAAASSSNGTGSVVASTSVAGSTASTSRTSRGAARTSGGDRVAKPPAKVRQPMTPAETMRRFADLLTPFEQSEVLEYQQVYFVGQPGVPKIKGIPHTTNNNGYDDERGDYKITQSDHLEYRYEVLGLLGRGSFGQVVKVLDHKKDAVLALKVIRNKKRFHHQALVEVKILEHLMGKDKEHKSNIVRVHGYFYFRNHLCITFEPLSINLYEFIKNNNFKGVSLSLIRRFAIQLLHALKFLRSERIIHCDLKPENVLLKSPNKSTIRLIDFGSSCFEDERIYTYIQSRFYRSPEVILGLPYDIAIDMWSFGCILSELYTGYPLFPGENETEQIQCIMEVLGVPPKRLIQASTRKKTFFDANLKPLTVPNSRGKIRHPGGKDLASATKCTDPQFISFLKKCLRWDPKLRITPEKALEHAWITEVVPPVAPVAQTGVAVPPARPSSDDDEDDKEEAKVVASSSSSSSTINNTSSGANITSGVATGTSGGNGVAGSETKRRSGGRTTGSSGIVNGTTMILSSTTATVQPLVPTAPTTAAPAIDPRASIRASGGSGATASMTNRSIASSVAATTTARGTSGDSLEQLMQQQTNNTNTDNLVT